jgi:hypothetical protein
MDNQRCMRIERDLGAYPLPVHSRERRLLGIPGRNTSPSSDRRAPHPPAAAPAAGGWGGPDLRCVHSVVPVWGLAGGVRERAARPEWRFGAEIFPSGGGGLRIAAARSLSSRCSRLCGAALHRVPSPESAGRRIRMCDIPEGGVAVLQDIGVKAARWRFSGTEDRRLPDHGGASPNPRHVRRSGGGAPSERLVRLRQRRDLGGPCCNFALFLDLSVRILL